MCYMNNEKIAGNVNVTMKDKNTEATARITQR